MSSGIPSLKYLKMLSNAVLDHERKYGLPLRNGQSVNTSQMGEDWKEIVLLAEEIHSLVVVKKNDVP